MAKVTTGRTTKTRSGGIPRPNISDPEMKRTLDAIISHLELKDGQRGETLDKAVTFRELDEPVSAKVAESVTPVSNTLNILLKNEYVVQPGMTAQQTEGAILAALNTIAAVQNGGTILFKNGTYNTSNPVVIDTDGVSLIGRDSTEWWNDDATGDVIQLGTTNHRVVDGSIKNIFFLPNVAKTAGAVISAHVGQYLFEDIKAVGWGASNHFYNGLWFIGDRDNPSATGNGGQWEIYLRRLRLQNGGYGWNGITFTDHCFDVTGQWFLLGGWSHAVAIPHAEAIDLSYLETTAMLDNDFQIEPDSSISQHVDNCHFTRCVPDWGYGHGFHFGGSGTIRTTTLDQCWAGSHGMVPGTGALSAQKNAVDCTAANLQGLYIKNSYFSWNAAHGIYVNAGSDIEISGCHVLSNSVWGSGSYPGIYIGNTPRTVRIMNNRAGGRMWAANNQSYGIFVAASCDDFMIVGNHTLGNVTGGINYPSGAATKLVANNL